MTDDLRARLAATGLPLRSDLTDAEVQEAANLFLRPTARDVTPDPDAGKGRPRRNEGDGPTGVVGLLRRHRGKDARPHPGDTDDTAGWEHPARFSSDRIKRRIFDTEGPIA